MLEFIGQVVQHITGLTLAQIRETFFWARVALVPFDKDSAEFNLACPAKLGATTPIRVPPGVYLAYLASGDPTRVAHVAFDGFGGTVSAPTSGQSGQHQFSFPGGRPVMLKVEANYNTLIGMMDGAIADNVFLVKTSIEVT